MTEKIIISKICNPSKQMNHICIGPQRLSIISKLYDKFNRHARTGSARSWSVYLRKNVQWRRLGGKSFIDGIFHLVYEDEDLGPQGIDLEHHAVSKILPGGGLLSREEAIKNKIVSKDIPNKKTKVIVNFIRNTFNDANGCFGMEVQKKDPFGRVWLTYYCGYNEQSKISFIIYDSDGIYQGMIGGLAPLSDTTTRPSHWVE